MTSRVTASAKAQATIEQLRHSHGELLFHLSGGCCDGSAPSCLSIEDFMINESDVLLGTVCDCSFYMSSNLFEYMRYSQIHLDIIEGKGSAFSLEVPLGYRFIARTRLMTESEVKFNASKTKKSGQLPES